MTNLWSTITAVMAFTVFLTHSLGPDEQVLAWRLQTLAAAHGINVYVSNQLPAHPTNLSNQVRELIDRADCVLAIMTSQASPNVQRELNYAVRKKRLIIPIVHKDLANDPFLGVFPHAFQFSPDDNPGKVETEVISFLEGQKITKEKQQAVGALVALGVGLLILNSLPSK